MRIVLQDGSTTDLAFCPANCAGYVAKSIIIDAVDVRAMRALAGKNPGQFILAMRQLEARFEEARNLKIAGVP